MLEVTCRHAFPTGFELDVSFQCGQGVTALFGPSGSGKTTILNAVSGFLRPQHARILINEQCILDSTREIEVPPQHRGIGYVPQDDLLFPHLTVKENLVFGMKGGSRPAIDFDQVVSMLHLADFLHRRPGSLSGGQRQRVALGRAVLCSPRLLLMDEPINALDATAKAQLIGDLCDLVARLNITAIFVSHDPHDVARFSEHKIILSAGRIVSSA